MNYYERLDYLSSDGMMWFDFVIMDCGPDIGWRVYIINVDDADYGYRDVSGHATHRNHFDGDTYKSICWSTPICSFQEAKVIAALWADTTALYIKKGGSFDAIAQKLSKK